LPIEIQYLWEWFWEMNSGRPVSQAGFLPLPATEILAWQELRDVRLAHWELDAVRVLDTFFLKAHAAERLD
jgi:hypothetical protein